MKQRNEKTEGLEQVHSQQQQAIDRVTNVVRLMGQETYCRPS